MMRRLLLEPPPEGDALAGLVTTEELVAAAGFSPARRREYLGWRALVRRELGPATPIAYNEVGAPVLPGSPLHLSIAHCKDRVAVCLSDAPCAVDVESAARDFSRVLPRYLSEAESGLSDNPLFPAAAWCAKEALYKYAGRRELDLCCDLHLEQVDFAAGCILGRILDGDVVSLTVRCDEGFVLVWIF